SFWARDFEITIVGADESKSVTPCHVLRYVIDAGSPSVPVRRTLVHVPFPRRFASAPLPSTICQEPLPPCSAGIGFTPAVNASAEPLHLNVRTAVSVSDSILASAANPEGQNELDVVNGPSCISAGVG